MELLLEDLPGALALLQEAGDIGTVLEWGGAWLAQPSNDAQVTGREPSEANVRTRAH